MSDRTRVSVTIEESAMPIGVARVAIAIATPDGSHSFKIRLYPGETIALARILLQAADDARGADLRSSAPDVPPPLT